MHSVLALVSLAIATTSLAAPALEQRQVPCLASVGSPVTFSASTFPRNETLPLGLISVPSSPPGSVSVLGVAPPSEVSFRLNNNTLVANDGPEFRGYSLGVAPGTPVTFLNGVPPPRSGLEPYCAQLQLPSANPLVLAVKGEVGNFAICKAPGNVRKVVYKPSPSNDGAYDVNTCVDALVRMQQIQQ